MTNLQNPGLPSPVGLIEIDFAIQDIQMKLDTNLPWLDNSYARAFRHFKKGEDLTLYVPEVFTGVKEGKKSYYRPTPDNDKKAMSFFAVGKESQTDYADNQFNYLSWPVGIIFSVNLDLIDPALLETELFTQNLIRDVRRILTTKLLGRPYRIEIIEVVREFREVYAEWTLEEDRQYAIAPQQIFRFNIKLTLREDCPFIEYDKCTVLNQNISENEILTCLLPTLDFSDLTVFNSLSAQQKADLTVLLCP